MTYEQQCELTLDCGSVSAGRAGRLLAVRPCAGGQSTPRAQIALLRRLGELHRGRRVSGVDVQRVADRSGDAAACRPR
jgi:hypothetical protein